MAITWSPKLAIGVPEIDAQHRELFVRVDALLTALQERRGWLHVQRTLKFLDGYVEEHFRDEIALMRETGYPGLKAHLAMHDGFVVELRKLQALIREAGEDASSTVAVRAGVLLFEWLRGHIGTSDRHFGDFLARRPAPAAEVA